MIDSTIGTRWDNGAFCFTEIPGHLRPVGFKTLLKYDVSHEIYPCKSWPGCLVYDSDLNMSNDPTPYMRPSVTSSSSKRSREVRLL